MMQAAVPAASPRGERRAAVIPQVLQAAPVTLSLVIGAAVIWMVLGVLLGTVSAATRGKRAGGSLT